MKLKKVLAAILCLAMVLSMAGCSLFTGGDGDGGKAAPEVKITDEFTHKDPEGLEYETRYPYYSGDSCSLVDMFQEYYDVTPTAEFIIIYADKDDVALAQFLYIVMESEEDAEKFKTNAKKVAGVDAQVFGDVTLQELDKEGVNNNIDSLIAWNVLTSTSAKEYAEEQKEMDMLVDYIPEETAE